MKVRVTACFIAVVIMLISTGGVMTSCASRNHMVEADNDMEIYVQASCIPIELKMTGRDAGTVKENPVFPFFNSLILFPHYQTYVYQTSTSFIGVSEPFDRKVLTGTYINRGDTIICLPDMEYREPDDKYMKRKTMISDTTDLTDLMSIPVVWFKRTSKDAVVRLNPYRAEIDLLNKLYCLKDSIGYVWTKEDYDFKSLIENDRKQLLRPMDYNSDLLYKDDSKSKKIGPHLPVFYKVPFKVKSKKVMGLAGSTTISKYYKPVKQY